MEYIKVARVDGVILHKRGQHIHGSLHLTPHHLIFTVLKPRPGELRELWVCYPMIGTVESTRGSALLRLLDSGKEDTNDDISRSILMQTLPKLHDIHGKELNPFRLFSLKLNCKDFQFLSFDFTREKDCLDVFDSIMMLTCLPEINQLYAFIYQPNLAEKKLNTWNIYDPIKEFERQGLDFINHSQSSVTNWRVSKINSNYKFAETYPSVLVVPKTISDNVLIHAGRYRSKSRIPALTYYHKESGCTITRCSQPLVGLKQSRSIQDEKLVDEMFRSSENKDTRINIIVDARPLTNAMAQMALGGGSESMDNYKGCDKVYLGIDNIHVMRDSMQHVVNSLEDGDLNKKVDKNGLTKSQWLKFISLLLSSTDKLVKSFALNHSNLLVHCSDGWDRTSQIVSLIQVCVDPYFRTIDGFITLVEKDWLSFGHRFLERSGHLSSESVFKTDMDDRNIAIKTVSNHFKKRKALKFTSPIFHQFIDAIYQLTVQHPEEFEYNERFLRRLVYHLYSCQFGNFLFDNEYERQTADVKHKTRSVWDYFLSRREEFSNKTFSPKETLIAPNFNKVKWWWQFYGRSDDELNGGVSTSINNVSPDLGGSNVENGLDSTEKKFQQMSVS